MGKLWGNICGINQLKPFKTISTAPSEISCYPPIHRHSRHFTAAPSKILRDSVGIRLGCVDCVYLWTFQVSSFFIWGNIWRERRAFLRAAALSSGSASRRMTRSWCSFTIFAFSISLFVLAPKMRQMRAILVHL